jgi:ribosomal protein S18 acetylase RimI-like enzyme
MRSFSTAGSLCRPVETDAIRIRRVRESDLPAVISLDARVTNLPKPEYWRDIYRGYGHRRIQERFFLVATGVGRRAPVFGFIVGEVRAWEFGSAPCGWVFALSVEPKARQHGVGDALFAAISQEFQKAGVSKMRTMVARDNRLHMLFFRGEGMMAGPYLQLEKELD